MARTPRKGMIFRLRDGGTPETKPRPILVLSRAELNGGNYLIVAPFTTKKLAERMGRPAFVLFEAGEFGLTERCILQADQIAKLDFSQVNTAQGSLGTVSADRLGEVDDAIRYVFAL